MDASRTVRSHNKLTANYDVSSASKGPAGGGLEPEDAVRLDNDAGYCGIPVENDRLARDHNDVSPTWNMATPRLWVRPPVRADGSVLGLQEGFLGRKRALTDSQRIETSSDGQTKELPRAET